MIDSDGVQPLSCRHSAGRFPRHSALKNIVKRAIDADGTHSVLELDRGDGRKPDGITVFSFQQGRSPMWNAIYFDAFAPSIITVSSAFPGCCSRRYKIQYASLAFGNHTVSISVETSSITSVIVLIKEVGCRIAVWEDDSQATYFFFQRFSHTIVREKISLSLNLSRETNSHEFVHERFSKTSTILVY